MKYKGGKKEARKRFYNNHKEEEHLYAAKYRKENREKMRLYHRKYGKQWRLKNKERVRHSGIKRKHLEKTKSYEKDLSTEYSNILRKDPCSYCGKFRKIQVDHIEPISINGIDNWTNFTAACIYCNSSKNNESLLRFMLRRR